MLDIAFKDFKAKRSRSVMVVIGVMTCVLLIGVVSIVTSEISEGLQGDANSLAGKFLFEANGTGYPPVGSLIPENMSNQVLANSVVNPSKSTALLIIPLPHGSSTSAIMVGLTPGEEQAYISGVKVNGSDSLVGESNNSVILGAQAASAYNVTVGDTFTVNNQQLKVIGVLNKQGTGISTTLDYSVIAPISFVQNFSQRPDLISADIITPNNGVSLNDAENTLQNSYNNSYAVYTQNDALNTLNTNDSSVFEFLNMITAMIFIVSTILIMVVMMMSVKEKTKDIGTMRALGTSRTKIMLLIMYESFIISGIGGIIGIILIIPLHNLLIILNGSTSFNYSIPIPILFEIILVVLVIGIFSGLIPAYLAMRISPIEALRYE
jgi:putative ABC transport system permease protein